MESFAGGTIAVRHSITSDYCLKVVPWGSDSHYLPPVPLPPHIPRFPLAANREHENGVDHGDIAVQGDVAMRAATDDERIHFA